MKKLFILFFALLSLFPLYSFSQSHTGIVKGRVTDSITGLPVENFTVFIPYTTKGTTTNSKGEFVLTSLPIGHCDLMFRHVAYLAVSTTIKINANEPVVINLEASKNTYTIEEITKRGKNANWEQSLLLFEKHFLGNKNGSPCRINNPEALYFYYEDDIFMAQAREPLEITNRYLGYEITYFLDYYKLYIQHIADNVEGREKARDGLNSFDRFKAGWTEPLNTAKVKYFQSFSGSAFYKDLAIDHPIRKINWNLNREAEFSGNLKHFLISLYHDTLSNSRYELRKAQSKLEDFEKAETMLHIDSIEVWDNQQNRPTNLYYKTNEKFELSGRDINTGSEPGEKVLLVDDAVLIFYDTEYTKDLSDDRIAEISIKGGQLKFDSFGNYDAPEGSRIWVYHDSGVKLKVLLPNDFLPKSEK